MRTSGDCGDRWTQPVCLVYLGLALLRVPPKEGNSLKRSLMIEWYLPLRAVSFPVLDSPLFFLEQTGGLLVCHFGRFFNPNTRKRLVSV